MMRLSKLLLMVFVFLSPTLTFANKIEHGQRFRALIIGIDGMKGYQFHQRVFQQNEAPHLKNLAESGQYAVCTDITDYHCARAHLGPRFHPSYSWVTSSGWAAVLTGVNTNHHLVKDNEFENQVRFYQSTHQYPTFMSQLQGKGFITAAGGVGNFITSMNGPGTDISHISTGIIDYECGIDKSGTSNVSPYANSSCNLHYRKSFDGDDSERDAKLTQWLLSMINREDDKSPDAIMGVYDTVDGAGHINGFSSNPAYFKAISRVDGYIGHVIEAISKRATRSNEAWLIMLTSDHGGHVDADGGGDHNRVLFHDEVVPFVITVVGNHISLVKHGQIEASNVSQMDVSPSVLQWFNVEPITTDGTIRSQYTWNK